MNSNHNEAYITIAGDAVVSFLARSIVFPVRNERFAVTVTDQTFHFIPTCVSVMINLLMTTFETPSRKVKFAIHNVPCTISLGFKYKPLFLYQILQSSDSHSS
jgi:hypothetical protein